jgi:hypothetical protein
MTYQNSRQRTAELVTTLAQELGFGGQSVRQLLRSLIHFELQSLGKGYVARNNRCKQATGRDLPFILDNRCYSRGMGICERGYIHVGDVCNDYYEQRILYQAIEARSGSAIPLSSSDCRG